MATLATKSSTKDGLRHRFQYCDKETMNGQGGVVGNRVDAVVLFGRNIWNVHTICRYSDNFDVCVYVFVKSLTHKKGKQLRGKSRSANR